MFERLGLAGYSADSIKNCGVFLSYYRESKSNACDFFAIYSAVLPGDYYDS